MQELICTVGLPRSGKSTWAREQGIPIVNPDSIRLAVHGQRFFAPAEPLVWVMAEIMIEALFKAGHGKVILDATNISRRRRNHWLKFDNTNRRLHEGESPRKVTFKVFNASAGECIRRAELAGDYEMIPVIKRMAKEWDWPYGHI